MICLFYKHLRCHGLVCSMLLWHLLIKLTYFFLRERSGCVVECLTRNRETLGLSLTGVTVLWSLKRHIYPSLVLVQPRKIVPF